MSESVFEFSGRTFSPEDLALVGQVTRDFAKLSLTEIAKTLCELLEWKRPTGKLKYEECRAFLEPLRDQGILSLVRSAFSSRGAGAPEGLRPARLLI